MASDATQKGSPPPSRVPPLNTGDRDLAPTPSCVPPAREGGGSGAPAPPLSVQNVVKKFAPKDAFPIIKLFVEQGYDMQERSAEGMDVLNASAFYDQALVLCYLLKKGFDAESKDYRGNTSLHQAAQQGRLGIIRILLKSNANVNAVNNDGFTPLHLSVSYDDQDCAELLLEYGADVNRRDKENQLAPLHCSTSAALTSILLKYNADLNIRNVQGWDPLYTASFINNIEKVKTLLSRGASVHSTTHCGKTPLQGAAIGGHKEVAQLLLDAGALINPGPANSPLHLACHSGHLELAAFLLSNGAQPVCTKKCVKCHLTLKRVVVHVPDDELETLPTHLRMSEERRRFGKPEDTNKAPSKKKKKRNKRKKKPEAQPPVSDSDSENWLDPEDVEALPVDAFNLDVLGDEL